MDLYQHTDTINKLLAHYGVKFGIYKNNTFHRISDEYLDPMNFYEGSLIGTPHLYDVYRKGNVPPLSN